MDIDTAVDKAIYNPASIFKSPAEILNDTKITLTKAQKILALKTWMYDIQLRRVAEEENMLSRHDEVDVRIEDEILQALAKLEPIPASPRIAPNKMGGF